MASPMPRDAPVISAILPSALAERFAGCRVAVLYDAGEERQLAESVRKLTKLPLDVHLMVVQPENYFETFAGAGADVIIVHQEVCHHLGLGQEGVGRGRERHPVEPVETGGGEQAQRIPALAPGVADAGLGVEDHAAHAVVLGGSLHRLRHFGQHYIVHSV